MGNRKERRRAAAGNSNRRVKLDLFAEPSGDYGGSSAQDEVGGEDDSKNRVGLSNSPSSSGQPQNPLLLLGQYSDDELDEGSKGTNTDQADGSLGEVEEKQAKVDDQENEDAGIIGRNDSVSKKVEEFIMEMDSMDKAGEDDQVAADATNFNNSNGDLHKSEQTVQASFDNQEGSITGSGWKMVLHEESNQYYYWNTLTGETSWVAPDVLALSTEAIYGDNEAIGGRQEDNGLASKHIDSLISDGLVDGSTLINGNNKNGCVFVATQEGFASTATEEKKGGDWHQGMLQSSYGPFDAQYPEMPVLESPGNVGDNLLGYQTASAGDPMVYGPGMKYQGENEDENKLSSNLMGDCENLLEQLRSMNRSKDDFVFKCIVEIETRLSDIKSLASHGSSLLPFWVHSEKQLLLLKATINDKIDKHEYMQLNEGENAHKPDGSDGANLIAGSAHEDSDVLSSDKGQKFSGAYENGILAIEQGSSAGAAEGAGDLDWHVTQDETTSNAILHYADDADMDVDMEVEDVIPPEMSTSEIHVAPMQALPSMPIDNVEASGPELIFSVPPPPEGDWIPPPPPDNEPFPPPPPPEEPPESPQPPPPGSEPDHGVSYAEQYNQLYPSGDAVYYGQTEIPGSNLYTYSNGLETAISQSSLYYNSGEAAFGVIPIVGAGEYYTPQDVASNPTSAAGLEPSIIGSVSGYTSFCPESIGSLNVHPPASYSLLPEIKSEALVVSGETKKASLEVPLSQPTVPSASVTSATVGPGASKGQAKVPRTKKRTGAVVSTLRSNKKVSSLVDKWKAAKEEMLEEEEEEPETYIEKLEKKRQREIEEWRAKQIASGEAKENANFQPLGGDWRERVKRKRAKLAKEIAKSPSEGSTERTEQPDLNKLSKGLPSGWQVYWDDSSKQVYYGNTITSETSWTKP